MARALRWLLGLVVVLASIGLLAALAAGPLLGRAIERIGSEATDTPVRVGGVDVAWTRGRITLHDVTIFNPEGFADRPALALGAVAIAIDRSALGGAPLSLRSLQIADPVAEVEVRRGGETNLAALQRNLERSAERGEPGPPRGDVGDVAAEKASRTRIRVENMVMDEGRAKLRAPALKEGSLVEVPLGAVTLDGVGGEGGARPKELVREIALALVTSTAGAVTESAVRKVTGSDEWGAALRDAAESAVEGVRDAARALRGE